MVSEASLYLRYTTREIDLYLDGMEHAYELAIQTNRGQTAAKAIRTEMTTLELLREKRNARNRSDGRNDPGEAGPYRAAFASPVNQSNTGRLRKCLISSLLILALFVGSGLCLWYTMEAIHGSPASSIPSTTTDYFNPEP